jgi:hypothetical protein
MMRLALSLVALTGCIETLEPGELGAARRVGDVFPGPISATLPPMTDRAGNLYVVTGVPDATGVPAPGVAHVGRASGGWTQGCATGELVRGSARGWVGATEGRGWLWSDFALLEHDTDGNCKVLLDRDPASTSDVTFHAVAPFVEETLSGNFAVAIVSTAAEPRRHIATIDLGLGTIAATTPLTEDVVVLGAGADRGTGRAVFAISDDDGARLVIVPPHGTIESKTPISGAMGPIAGEIVVAGDALAAVVAADAVRVGDRSAAKVIDAPLRAVGVEQNGSELWLVGDVDGIPHVAQATPAGTTAAHPWTCAIAVDRELDAGIVVIDDRLGERIAATWNARSALGELPLINAHGSPAYAQFARALLVAGPSIDRGGITYNQLAVVPAGVSFP